VIAIDRIPHLSCATCRRGFIYCVFSFHKSDPLLAFLNGLNRSAISRLLYATEINALDGRDGRGVGALNAGFLHPSPQENRCSPQPGVQLLHHEPSDIGACNPAAIDACEVGDGPDAPMSWVMAAAAGCPRPSGR
jgi:hypothetical protein